MIIRVVIFLLVNFGALVLGGLFMGDGPTSEYYTTINKAPWTPPGWVFGAAWTSIMICFSIYLALLWPNTENKSLLLGIFSLQFILNVLWNPVFFYYHNAALGMVIIVLLTMLVWWFLIHYFPAMKWMSLLILPYAIWLVIASSLNGYILFMN
jgi:tryptophan-rich sensory protein